MTFNELIEFLREVDDLGVLNEQAKRDIRDCGLSARYGPSIMEHLHFKNVDERYNIPPSTNDDGKELGR